MRNVKRLAGILLALAMICIMVLPCFAAELTGLKGSITITDTETVKASEKYFAAYKILDLKVYGDTETNEIDTYSYTVPRDIPELVAFYENYFGLDSTAADFDVMVVAKINEINEEGRLYDFAKAVLEQCAPKLVKITGDRIEGGYRIENMPLGYYLIDDITNPAENSYKPVSALALQTATPDVTVEVKAEKPGIDKEIDDDNDLTTTDDRVDANEAAIGDTITYVITSKVPSMIGYDKYYFIMHDTMSKGLDYTNSMVITIGDKTLVEGVDFTVTKTDNADETTDLKIVFNNFVQYNTEEFADAPIVVSYTAKLNEKCEVNTIPNTNTVKLEYSNNPKVECDGENEPSEEDKEKNPTGVTPEVTVETYTTTLEIVKTDPNGKRLQGAEFTLTGTAMNTVRVETETFELDPNGEYWKLVDGSFTTTDPESIIDGVAVSKEKYESLTDKYSKHTTTTIETREGETLTITGTVGEDGVLRFEGIPSGEYTITETKAPEGYNKLIDSITVTINAEYVEEAGEGHIVYTYEGATDVNGVARVTVVNSFGDILPSTGGSGTTMFYIIGGLLAVAAVVLLVSRKRMSAEA